MKLNEQIRFFRKAKGMKLWQLAARSGISSTYMSLIEKGVKKPSMDVLEKICKALEVDLNLTMNG